MNRMALWVVGGIVCVLNCAGVSNGDDQFFPAGSLDDRSAKNQIMTDYTERRLKEMGEPSIWRRSREAMPGMAFRFLWLPSEGNRISVHIRNEGGDISLKFVAADPIRSVDSGRKVIAGEISVSPQQWEKLATLVERANFWAMESRDKNRGLDGEDLVFEGRINERYHVVDRWTPSSGAYRRLCRFMIDLARVDIGKSWYETRHVVSDLGRFVVIVKGSTAVALRFLRHTEKGGGGAIYEWFSQEDGSNDFSRPNLKFGTGEVFEKDYEDKNEQKLEVKQIKDVRCGEISLWWQKVDESHDQIYVSRDQLNEVSVASTKMLTLENIDLDAAAMEWIGKRQLENESRSK